MTTWHCSLRIRRPVTFATLEKNGGRLEYRRCRKLAQLQKDEWPGFAIDRRVTTKKGISTETGYYISSSDFSAKKLMEIAREHWKVESMHWMLDVVFSEAFPLFHRKRRISRSTLSENTRYLCTAPILLPPPPKKMCCKNWSCLKNAADLSK